MKHNPHQDVLNVYAFHNITHYQTAAATHQNYHVFDVPFVLHPSLLKTPTIAINQIYLIHPLNIRRDLLLPLQVALLKSQMLNQKNITFPTQNQVVLKQKRLM